jgi:hypothetical protein
MEKSFTHVATKSSKISLLKTALPLINKLKNQGLSFQDIYEKMPAEIKNEMSFDVFKTYHRRLKNSEVAESENKIDTNIEADSHEDIEYVLSLSSENVLNESFRDISIKYSELNDLTNRSLISIKAATSQLEYLLKNAPAIKTEEITTKTINELTIQINSHVLNNKVVSTAVIDRIQKLDSALSIRLEQVSNETFNAHTFMSNTNGLQQSILAEVSKNLVSSVTGILKAELPKLQPKPVAISAPQKTYTKTIFACLTLCFFVLFLTTMSSVVLSYNMTKTLSEIRMYQLEKSGKK